jgi:hypothetical protein
MVLQCNRTLESAFAGIEQHVPDVAPRIPTAQRNGMGSTSVEFPPSHSTAFGDPLRRVKESFMKNLTFIALVFDPILRFSYLLLSHHTVSVMISLLVSLASGSLRSSSFPCYHYIHTYIHTYSLVVPTCLSASDLRCLWVAVFDRFLYSLHASFVSSSSSSFLLHCSASRYIPYQIQQRTTVLNNPVVFEYGGHRVVANAIEFFRFRLDFVHRRHLI